jgi:cytochrome P450
MRRMPPPPVTPAPPRVAGRLPWVGAGLSFLANPTGFLRATRDRLGDSFLLEAFGFRLFFVFSPEGLRSLYALPEKDASFTEATRRLIGFKLPPELLGGEMAMFHHLFGRDRLETYRAEIAAAVDEQLASLGDEGELEIFSQMKQLVHRVGFRCWAGREAASSARLPRLIELFEKLDPEEAFVRPARIFVTLATRKAGERRALAQVQEILTGIWRERERLGTRAGDMLEALHELYRDLPETGRHERVARDVVILHLASQSNLYAAISWTLVNLLLHPQWQAEARAQPALLEACALESIRLAQRSLTLRKVMQPCRVSDGATEWQLQPGVYVATLLSVGNQALPGHSDFDPEHYERGRPSDRLGLPMRESISTFGHGSHACPGRRFALAAIGIAVCAYLARFELTPRFQRAEPKPGQMGAVARAASPCRVAYRRR